MDSQLLGKTKPVPLQLSTFSWSEALHFIEILKKHIVVLIQCGFPCGMGKDVGMGKENNILVWNISFFFSNSNFYSLIFSKI